MYGFGWIKMQNGAEKLRAVLKSITEKLWRHNT
jgi:hypothetical protein